MTWDRSRLVHVPPVRGRLACFTAVAIAWLACVPSQLFTLVLARAIGAVLFWLARQPGRR